MRVLKVNSSQLSFLSFNKLGILLFGVLIVPLILNKYGVEKYGTFVFYQAIIGFYTIFFKYGFEIRGIKILGENKNKRYYLINILVLQHILFIIGLIILSLFNIFIQKSFILILLYFSSYREIGFSDFYYIEEKKSENLFFLNLISRVPILYFLLFQSINFKTFITIYSISFLVTGMINSSVLFSKKGRNDISLSAIKILFLEGFYFFSSKIIGGAKDKILPISIGALIGPNILAIYDIGIKLINLGSIPVTIINQFYLGVQKKNKLKRLTILIMTWTLLYSIILVAFRSEILIYLNINNVYKIKLLPILVILGLSALNTSSFVGTNVLVAKGLDKYYFKSAIGTIIISFVIIISAISLGLNKWYHLLFLTFFIYSFEAILRYYYARKNL